MCNSHSLIVRFKIEQRDRTAGGPGKKEESEERRNQMYANRETKWVLTAKKIENVP